MTLSFAARVGLFAVSTVAAGDLPGPSLVQGDVPPEPFPAGLAKGAYRVGPGITEPVVLKTATPDYPAAAEAKRIVGDVEVLGVVLPDGTVGPVRALTSLDASTGIDDEALSAARRYTFKPALKDNSPVPVVVTFFIRFRLPGLPEPDLSIIGGTADPPIDAPIPEGVFRPGRGLLRPLPVTKVYPASRLSEPNAGGRVDMLAVIMPDGSVGDVQVRDSVAGRDALESQAVKAVRQWTFEPALKDGVAVPVALTAFIELRRLRRE